MEDKIIRLLGRLLRLPPEPEAPEAPSQVFRAARPYYTLLLLTWGAKQIGTAFGLMAGIYSSRYLPDIHLRIFSLDLGRLDPILAVFEVIAVLGFFAQIPFTLAMVRVDYLMRWYIVTAHSLRIREGVWQVREMTMSFANIQQITVKRNPLQGLLGIADVKVRSAGGGSGADPGEDQDGHGRELHLAYFRGVADYEAISRLLRERAGCSRDAGLGDPDEEALARHPAPGKSLIAAARPDLRAAAEALYREARALRVAIEP